LEEKVGAPVYKADNKAVGDPLCRQSNTLYQQKLALTLPTRGYKNKNKTPYVITMLKYSISTLIRPLIVSEVKVLSCAVA
jgi:hypothetical protein